jgi:hypothetical protein
MALSLVSTWELLSFQKRCFDKNSSFLNNFVVLRTIDHKIVIAQKMITAVTKIVTGGAKNDSGMTSF